MKKNLLTLTDEVLALASTIKVREMDIPSNTIMGSSIVAGIENKSVYGGSDVLEDVSLALGCYDKHDVDSEENSNGIQFEKSLEDKMFDIHEFVMDNLINIETLIHYWSNKGGLTAGTYNVVTLQKVE